MALNRNKSLWRISFLKTDPPSPFLKITSWMIGFTIGRHEWKAAGVNWHPPNRFSSKVMVWMARDGGSDILLSS